MALSAGTRLGHYEVVAPLGAGGMGEVYRARDTRLSRHVAIKVLPSELASDAGRLKRFETEALSASSLNHPNIVTIYEFSRENGTSFLAMELVEGKNLRSLLSTGPIPVRRTLEIAAQLADGLARAHASGIVHRDLKPENVMITQDRHVKILDFGLAKLDRPESGSGEGVSQSPTLSATGPGVVVGTVGYMSPEQAMGQPVDFRSDQFSLGSILYEMVTGKQAFVRSTTVDTLSAILHDEPRGIAEINPATPAPARWIVERCLAKEPRARYASTEDLAHELAHLREHLSEISTGEMPSGIAGPSRARWIAWPALGAALLAVGFLAASWKARPPVVPRFQQVTFQPGGLWRARFAPGGDTIVFAMRGVEDDLKPGELFSTRGGSLDWRSLGLPPADIYSVSRTGRLAVALVSDPLENHAPATLAESSLDGAAPRPILERVVGADWSPDGKALAVVSLRDGVYRLEYPIGKKIYESNLGLFEPRVSPDGESVAVVEEGERSPLRVLDRGGTVRTPVEDTHGSAACWSPDGRELWWVRQPASFVHRAQTSELHAVTLGGRDRLVTCLPGEMNLLDIATDGRLLVEEVSKSFTMSTGSTGTSAERNLAWLDQSVPVSFSPDGKTLAFADRGDVTGSTVAAYLRKLDASTSVRLGEGNGGRFSPDGKWVTVCRKLPKHYIVLIPTGAGEERVLEPGTMIPDGAFVFHPDGKRIYMDGIEAGHRQRVYEQSVDGTPPKPVTPEGYVLQLVSPDGKLFMARSEEARDVTLFPTDPGSGIGPRTVALQSTSDWPIHWSQDGGSVLVLVAKTRPIRVDRLDLATGRRTPWRSFSPGFPLAAGGVTGLAINRDEDAWAVGYCRQASTLFVISGLS